MAETIEPQDPVGPDIHRRMSRARPAVRSCCCCTAFPRSRHSWRAALPALAAAGYRAVAPDQRGYSPGARPDPADLSNYAFDKLVADAIEIAAAAGHDGKRFHLVGHDWGGQVSWGVADSASRAARLAHHPVAAASQVVPPRAAEGRRRPEASLAPSSRVPRAGDRQDAAGRQCAPPARRPVRPGRAGGRARGASFRAGQSRGDRSGTRLVSRQQGSGGRHRRHQGADALSSGATPTPRSGPMRAHGTGEFVERGLRHGSAAGRRPFRHGPGAGQGHRS